MHKAITPGIKKPIRKMFLMNK